LPCSACLLAGDQPFCDLDPVNDEDRNAEHVQIFERTIVENVDDVDTPLAKDTIDDPLRFPTKLTTGLAI